MIKIETSKNFAAPKNGLTNTGQTTGDNANNVGESESAEGGGEFARVLENLTSKKEDGNPQANTGKLKEREKDFHSQKDENNKTDLPAKDKSSDPASIREDAAGAGAAQLNNNDNSIPEGELSLPPARAIMHIADLERIISTIRSQTFDGNSQVVITMKNSVCSGLQIKLTTDQNQRVTAEFIAANEKVKAQIDARSGELADLLRQRGVKLAGLQTSVGAESSNENGKQQDSGGFETQPLLANVKSPIDLESEQIQDKGETANTYRV